MGEPVGNSSRSSLQPVTAATQRLDAARLVKDEGTQPAPIRGRSESTGS